MHWSSVIYEDKTEKGNNWLSLSFDGVTLRSGFNKICMDSKDSVKVVRLMALGVRKVKETKLYGLVAVIIENLMYICNLDK